MSIAAIMNFRQNLPFRLYVLTLTILLCVLGSYASSDLSGEETADITHPQLENWYTTAELKHLHELTKTQKIDLNNIHDLKEQLSAISKSQGASSYNNIINPAIFLQLNTNNALPKFIVLPVNLYPDKKISFMAFMELLEQQSRGSLMFQEDKLALINPRPQSNPSDKAFKASLSGDSVEIARIKTVQLQEIKSNENLPGRVTHQLQWQFEPRVQPLRIHWQADANHWLINNIEMTPLDKGAVYERNVSAQKLITQDFRFLLPEFIRTKSLTTKITGQALFTNCWGDLEFELHFNLPKTAIPPLKKNNDRISIYEWKKKDIQNAEFILDFDIKMPPLLKLNSADVGLIKPKMELLPLPVVNISDKDEAILGQTNICKLIHENIDSTNNKIHWKYEINPENSILTSLKDFNSYQLKVSIPYFVTKNVWHYEISIPIDP
jgi:hypothetical protein